MTVLALALLGCPSPNPPDSAVPPVHVVSIVPSHGTLDVPPDSAVEVVFSAPVAPDAGTVDLGVAATVTWNAAGDTLTVRPDTPLGSLVDIRLDLTGFTSEPATSTFTTQLADRMTARPQSGAGGTWAFVDIAPEAGADFEHGFTSPQAPLHPLVAGVAVGDYDHDGFIDIYTGRGDVGPTQLLRNLGDGTYADVGATAGVEIDDAIVASPGFVDVDGDGDLDIYAPATFSPAPSYLFVNDGDGTFHDGIDAIGLTNSGADFVSNAWSTTWGDYDADGDLDVFHARFGVDDPSDPRFLYRNDGDGTFTDVSAEAWLYVVDIQQSFTTRFADMDDDGFPEVLVAADHGYSVYLRNNGDGTFLPDTEVALTDENGMGAAVGDYDNDGDLDWFVAAIYDPDGVSEFRWGVEGNRLYDNDGTGHLVDVSEAAGVRDGGWGWGACFADLDLDGHLDLFHVNGVVDHRDTNAEYTFNRSRVFHGDGDGTFTERGLELGIADETQGRGISCYDHDRDGDVDLLVANWMGRAHLYRNDLPAAGHFLNVQLEGRSPNTEGVGARVWVTVDGTTQMRELHLGSNYGSHDPVEAVFGLGAAQVIDSLRVRWPDGTENQATDVPADRFVRISQPPR